MVEGCWWLIYNMCWYGWDRRLSATLKPVHSVFNSMCQFFFYLIHKIDWDFTWIMIQSWSIHVGTSQLWGSLRPFLNGLINVWHCHTSIKPSNVFKGALQVWDAPIHGSMVNGQKNWFLKSLSCIKAISYAEKQ